MPFEPPPGYQSLVKPAQPCCGSIYGGLKVGMSLCIQGTVNDNPNRTYLNLMVGQKHVKNLAFHFNPRFQPHGHLVMNSIVGGSWGREERPEAFPFSAGADFQLIVTITSQGFQIKVNGSEIHLYPHRMPVEEVDTYSIGGDCAVHIVNIIGGGNGSIQGYPGLGRMLSIPYVGSIYGGLKKGMSVKIQGAVPCDVTRFHISLQCAEAKCSNKALYINPRFNPAEVVVFNSFMDGKFQEQERATHPMPFKLGESFELVIEVQENRYQVIVDGRDFYGFAHRMPVERVLAVAIGGDVYVSSVNVMGGGAIEAWPARGYVGKDTYTHAIPGGLKAGMTVYLRGAVPTHNYNRFQIDLRGGGDLAFHFNPRFRHGELVAMNTHANGGWQSEEKIHEFPFRKGKSFELVYYVTTEGYEVCIDGRQVYLYKHRVPLEQVDELCVGGEVSVQAVNIIREEERIMALPAPGDVSSNPFSHNIEGGLQEGMSLLFEGTVHSQINRFQIDLQGGGDLAFHFNPRFKHGEVVVMNTHANGGWQSEERIHEFPFQKGKSFKLVFYVTTEGYEVCIDGRQVYLYKHRVPLEQVDELCVGGDVSVQAVNIIRGHDDNTPAAPEHEEEHIMALPAPGNVSSNPFSMNIEGGLQEGMSLFFEGTVHSQINRFHINLEGEGKIVLHFKVNFHGTDYVTYNTNWGRGWDNEDRVDKMPFSAGGDFQLLFNLTSEGYETIINGQVFHTFRHRIPLTIVTTMGIGGDVTIRTINVCKPQGIIKAYPGEENVKEKGLSHEIDGGLRPGKSLCIYGAVPKENINNFHVNLEGGGANVLHFRPYYRYGLVVFNTHHRGWQKEERVGEMPFQAGDHFDLIFNVTLKGYQVIINGQMFHLYKHRLAPDQVTHVNIAGDIIVHSINTIWDTTGGGEETGYNWRFLPKLSAEPIFNPAVPLTKIIPGGLTLKQTITFGGRVPYGANRFAIDFYVCSTGDRALHFNPRIKNGTVVRNSKIHGRWGKEERDFKFNPFQEGQYFEVMIRCGRQKFKVFVNGKHMFNFNHRFQPFTKIDKMTITQDVQLFYLLI